MSEKLVLVDEKDQVLGEVETNEAHEKGVLHRTVHIFIANKERELFCRQRSFKKKVYPGYWSTSVGVHVLPGEGYEETAKRGLTNTLGIDCELEFIGKSRIKDEFENEISATFVGYTDEDMKFNPDEIEGGRFLTVDEIRKLSETQNTTPHLMQALEHYLEHKDNQ